MNGVKGGKVVGMSILLGGLERGEGDSKGVNGVLKLLKGRWFNGLVTGTHRSRTRAPNDKDECAEIKFPFQGKSKREKID
jgi:hypothetical protein